MKRSEKSCFEKLRNRELGARAGSYSHRNNSTDRFRNVQLQVRGCRTPLLALPSPARRSDQPSTAFRVLPCPAKIPPACGLCQRQGVEQYSLTCAAEQQC